MKKFLHVSYIVFFCSLLLVRGVAVVGGVDGGAFNVDGFPVGETSDGSTPRIKVETEKIVGA